MKLILLTLLSCTTILIAQPRGTVVLRSDPTPTPRPTLSVKQSDIDAFIRERRQYRREVDRMAGTIAERELAESLARFAEALERQERR